MNMVTNLQLMQFGVPLTYAMSGFSIGITPILQYGALDINYDMDPSTAGSTGAGVAQDLKFGYNIGAAFAMSGFTIGASYKSPIEMEYKGQLSSATQPFVDAGIFPGAMADKLQQPSEMGVGASYEISGNTIALDYKKIAWSSAKGYEQFGWDDQNVIALGYQYATDTFAIRLGYNKANNPIKDAGAMTMAGAMQAAGMETGSMDPAVVGAAMPKYFGGNALNTFNLLGFPATVESHMTVGGTYNFSKSTSLDLAYVYAPETSTTLTTMPDMTNGMDMSTTVKHSQTSVSFQLNFLF
jgi:long-chain fatty acid transport protein